MTRGVLYRVDELADREEGFVPENSIPYKSLVPFDEIIADVKGVGVKSKAVANDYFEFVNAFGSELNIMTEADDKELFSKMPEKIALGVKKVRDKQLQIKPGHDGEYGIIKIFGEEEESKTDSEQMTLF